MEKKNDKLINLFEYLKAYYTTTRKQTLDVANYDNYFWKHELPESDGCYFNSKEDKENLVIEKQDVPHPPEPPETIKNWIEGNWKDPIEDIKFIKSKYQKVSSASNEANIEYFEDSERRKEDWDNWYFNQWKQWKKDALPKRRVQELYKQMFLLSQRIERQQDELELIWGYGILYWQIEDKKIRHPVITTKADIKFDDKSGKIIISTHEMAEPSLEIEFLNSLKDSQIRDLTTLKDELKDKQINPLDKTQIKDFTKRLINLLGPDGKLHLENMDLVAEDIPIITYEPALILRKKRAGYRQDIEEILSGLEEGRTVPLTIHSIFDKEKNEAYQEIGSDELMFPLPSNEEQKQIVERLSKNTGVTVQGPPGTGKSHTIANLISHMLAHGKRVLVTAKSERPLRVIREMIPKKIQPLCVNLFTDESSFMSELEEAVKTISQAMGTLNFKDEEENLSKLKEKIKEIRENKAVIKNKIKKTSEFETSTYNLMGQEYTLPQLSTWLTENEQELNWITDNIPQNQEIPLTDKELARLYELVGILDHKDIEKLEDGIKDIGHLPTGKELQEMHEEIDELTLKTENTESNYIKSTTSDISEEEISGIISEVRDALNEMKTTLNEDWLNTIFQDAKNKGPRKEQWLNLVQWANENIYNLYQLQEKISEDDIDLPSDANLNNLLEMIKEMENNLSKKENIGVFTRIFNSNVRYLQQNCKVNGLSPKSMDDAQKLKNLVEKKLLEEKLVKRWEKQIVPIGGPIITIDDHRLAAKVDDNLKLIETAIQWEEETWEPLVEKLKNYGFSVPNEVTVENIEKLIEEILYFHYKAREKKVRTNLNKVKEDIKSQLEKENKLFSLWKQLSNSLLERDYNTWDNTISELSRLKNLELQYQELIQLFDKLQEIAPNLAKHINSQGGKGSPLEPPKNIKRAWEWRRAETWLSEALSEDPIQLSKDLDELRTLEKKLLERIVSLSTWLNLSKSVTEENRQNLIAWQQTIKRIGKGTGKYANRYRKQAREKMSKAQKAVPVWIMPFNKVIESFSPWNDQFDLVIVDESSQVDIFGVLAFFRANQVLIVGDDKQISPQGVGQDLQSVHRLMTTYLKDVEHGELFEPKYSLYDLSKQIFPGVIMLKEHFRCLPEIIQFSNDLMYQGDILPLKEKMGTVGNEWSPVIKVKVENGYRPPNKKINEPEAEKLVETILECCTKEEYSEKSMGVISLLGSEQAQLIEELLMDKLGPREIKNRKIRCGDAYYFQGDERDVIFLTMVDAKGENRVAVLKKEDDFKRFNVAVSRSRDQVWLFHSIDTQDLNSQDVRSRLINYFKNPYRVQNEYDQLEELCESEFERRVLKGLLNLGYAVKPQYKVGHKRIDLVVLGMNKNKLAVECDGDAYHGIENWEEDWDRQVQLERLGWKFFRIRGSAYYRNPEKVIKDLVTVLNDMEIHPQN